ncbi:hypothetical protein HYU13_04590 [Candidatus Woesearchaeota archaeon]|nr:hypothetical protein [Candidatus Woesearchaeota archaeon]
MRKKLKMKRRSIAIRPEVAPSNGQTGNIDDILKERGVEIIEDIQAKDIHLTHRNKLYLHQLTSIIQELAESGFVNVNPEDPIVKEWRKAIKNISEWHLEEAAGNYRRLGEITALLSRQKDDLPYSASLSCVTLAEQLYENAMVQGNIIWYKAKLPSK